MSGTARQRAWEIAERLSRAGGGDAKLATTPTGYRIELTITRPDDTADHRAVLDALALGDHWGHHYSPPSRNNGTAREVVWAEVHSNPGEREGS
ncbi:hypothetical protein HUT16_28150 [Kitasatospora sp. NA04385]|uniref:hypothetical protein n=1 Tax=Kitasatospora sp. NA04385 TaxID=2742135 RepID=UPI001590AAC4|nr:hypothetical protein [Kitasatospora sp. NA04385]QKW22433.1 hypothetical protein HUT16_28150 [Kitasatospora sp. NA04385]